MVEELPFLVMEDCQVGLGFRRRARGGIRGYLIGDREGVLSLGRVVLSVEGSSEEYGFNEDGMVDLPDGAEEWIRAGLARLLSKLDD
jgi:hypothetical protein